MRRCIACRESKPQDELIRFTLKDGSAAPDPDKPADGRGYYLCREQACLDTAIRRKAFNRICRRNVDPEEIKSIFGQMLNNN